MPPKLDVAVFTTAYPGVEGFLAEWYRSLANQTDRDWHLWIALDGLSPAAVRRAIGSEIDATWVQAVSGDTPAQLRQRAWSLVVERSDAVVLVDADDLLHPTRVAAARRAMERAELHACALRLVDAGGRDLGLRLAIPPATGIADVLPLRNVFGLSNTTYRSGLLRRCMPLPADTRAVDWFLATRAWLLGAEISFDPVARMDYRQHPANMTAVQPPFGTDTIRRDTGLVRTHLARVAEAPRAGTLPDRLRALAAAVDEVAQFERRVVDDPRSLDIYAARLAELPWTPLWWAHVAHPALRAMWGTGPTRSA